ncbi:MAG: phosphate ABC transporter permease subunit PstC [Bacteroidota bacterium]
MQICLFIVILIPFLLLSGLFFKSALLVDTNSFYDLLFTSEWKPLSGKFGLLSFIISSLYVTIIAILIAGPVCVLTAVFITHYAKSRILRIMHPVIDILAGLPSVLYGVWGILIIVPFVSNNLAPVFGKETSGYSIIAGGIVLSVMITPFILNILIEIFRSIPAELSEASLSLGASKWQTIKHTIVRKAMPGIISAFGLGISRAFGETIAVLMVTGNMVKMPRNILDPGYPLPALIANNYGEMMSIPRYDSALMFAALVLFLIVILFNFASRLLITSMENTISS